MYVKYFHFGGSSVCLIDIVGILAYRDKKFMLGVALLFSAPGGCGDPLGVICWPSLIVAIF